MRLVVKAKPEAIAMRQAAVLDRLR